MADQISSLTVEVNTKGTDQAKAALGQLGVNARKAEASVKKYKEETQRSTKAQKAYAKAQEQSNAQVSQAATVHKQARGGFRAMRGATQQLSYQLQDVAVQAQAGTDGLRILAQQGPQILSIFGPAGAITGALVAFGALFASVLIPNLEDAEEEVDNLGDSLDRLDRIAARTQGGIFALSDEFAELARRSAALAELELTVSMTKAQRGLEDQMGKIKDALDISGVMSASIKSFENYKDELDGVVETSNEQKAVAVALKGRVGELARSIGITSRQTIGLVLAFKQFQAERTPETFQALNSEVLRLSKIADSPNLFANFLEVFSDSAQGIYAATDALADYRKAQEELASGDFTSKSEKEAERREQEALDRRLAKKMRFNARVLKQNERRNEAIERQEASLQLFLNNEAERNLQKRAKDQQRADELMARARTDNAVIFAEKQRVLLDLEQARQILSQEQFLEYSKAMLEEFAAWKAEYHQREADRAALELAKQLEAQKTHLDRWKEQTAAAINDTSLLATSMAISLEQSMAGAFEGFLTGTMNAKEAFKEFVKGMLKSFLQAIAQMIAKRMALAVVEKLTGKAAAAGQAAYTGFISQSQVLMAGLNAFTSTAAIPVVGPALAPAAMATAIGVASPLAAGATAAAAAAATARSTGGQVRGGQTYLVGEQGPELLSMGTSGRISSNDQLKQAMGGGESVQIVNNIDARGADASVEMKIRAAVEQSSQATIATIQDLMRRRRFV
jgi:hypothetical protein